MNKHKDRLHEHLDHLENQLDKVNAELQTMRLLVKYIRQVFVEGDSYSDPR